VASPILPKIDISFSPAWWYHHYGMAFDDPRVWSDPIRYTERDRDQRRILYERFGDVGLGEANPAPKPRAGDEYGHRWMSAFWGCEVVYLRDQAPHAVALPDAWDRMHNLELPQVAGSRVAQRTLDNARILCECYGSCDAAINYGGPLNNAVSVLGEAIYLACAGEPDWARRVLMMMGQAIMIAHDEVACRIRHVDVATARSGGWGIGNCPVGTLSPEMYRDLVLPIDLWFKDQFQGPFGLHHCGLFHPYADVYRPLAPASLDIGPGSNVRATRGAFPQAMLSMWLDVGRLAHLSAAEMEAWVAQALEEGGPAELIGWIGVAEVGPDVSDQTVRDWLTVCQRLRLQA
jgi:hypothetical protein